MEVLVLAGAGRRCQLWAVQGREETMAEQGGAVIVTQWGQACLTCVCCAWQVRLDTAGLTLVVLIVLIHPSIWGIP